MMEALAPPTIAAPPTGDTITAWLAWLVANQALIIAALTAIAPILVACASLYLKLKASRLDVRDGDTALEVLGRAIEAAPGNAPPQAIKHYVHNSLAANPPAVRDKIKAMVERIDPKRGRTK
jgi:hypothetical protein